MRTTVEFPPALIRAAKARSAALGESLKALLARAVTAELGGYAVDTASRARVQLPLFGEPGRAAGPLVNLTNADLERALADVDATRAAAHSSRRRRRTRR